MHKINLLIAAALALPVLMFTLFSNSHSQAAMMSTAPVMLPATDGNASHKPATLEEAREQTKNRLLQLETMSDEQWQEERQQTPHRSNTLPEAIQRNKEKLVHLESITPEAWAREQKR